MDATARYHEVPAPHWLVSTVNGQKEREWFVRFEIGGLYPRRLGPFTSQQEAVAHYNETTRRFLNVLVGNPDAHCFIEDTLGAAYLTKRKRP